MCVCACGSLFKDYVYLPASISIRKLTAISQRSLDIKDGKAVEDS